MNLFPTYILYACILPKIFAVPTPTAIPANLLSTSLIILHLLAHYTDIIVLYAPLSTKAYIGVLLTSISIYSIVTLPNDSGKYCYA